MSNESNELSERQQVIAQAMNLLWMGSGVEPLTETNLKRRLAAWEAGLEEIPTGDILEAAAAVLRHRTSDRYGPPTPGDLVARWKGSEHDGAPNAEAYRPFVPGENSTLQPTAGEMAYKRGLISTSGLMRTLFLEWGRRERAGRGNVVCHCGQAARLTPDSSHWECQQPERCDFRWPVVDTMNAPPGNQPPRGVAGLTAAGSSAELPAMPKPPDAAAARMLRLKAALDTRCQLDTDAMDPEIWQAFGAWLAARVPVAQWTNPLAAVQWELWQKEAQATALGNLNSTQVGEAVSP